MKEIFSDTPDHAIVRQERSPEFMSEEIVDRWMHEIKFPGEDRFSTTLLAKLNLRGEGLGEIIFKEASTSHPLNNVQQLALMYREFARVLWMKTQVGPDRAETVAVPRISLVLEDERGAVLAEYFRKHNLPAPKFIIGSDADQATIDRLSHARAEIFQIDLGKKKLTSSEILKLTNNVKGVDVTQALAAESENFSYDDFVHEILNVKPERVYMPMDSGRLRDSFLYWQGQVVSNEEHHRADRRFRASLLSTIRLHVCAGQTESDDLHAIKPFINFSARDIKSIKEFHDTGSHSGTRAVDEGVLDRAVEILEKHGFDGKRSGAAGLALYMMDVERGDLGKNERVMVVK